MADRLMKKCQLRLLLPAVLLANLWLAGNVQAQSALTDPTRPPNGVTLGSSSEGSEKTVLILQSVIRQRGKSPVAIINGEMVKLGGLYGESRLTRLTEKEAVLESESGVEHLLLTPDVTIVPVKTSSGKPAVKQKQARSTKP